MASVIFPIGVCLSAARLSNKLGKFLFAASLPPKSSSCNTHDSFQWKICGHIVHSSSIFFCSQWLSEPTSSDFLTWSAQKSNLRQCLCSPEVAKGRLNSNSESHQVSCTRWSSSTPCYYHSLQSLAPHYPLRSHFVFQTILSGPTFTNILNGKLFQIQQADACKYYFSHNWLVTHLGDNWKLF